MLTDDLNNSGTVVNYGTYTANVASNSGTITNNNSWYGSVNNTGGIITNNWAWYGSANNMGGTINNTGTWYGSVNNTAGTITNYNLWYGSANNTGGTIDNRAEWNGDITNASGSVFNEGTIVGAVTNSGTITNNNLWYGSAINTGGTIDNRAEWNGDITNASGAVSNEGTIVGTVTNSGVFDDDGRNRRQPGEYALAVRCSRQERSTVGFQNSGQFTLTGNLYSDQPFFNNGSGSVQTTRPSVMLATPSFNNNGVLDLRNPSTVATNSVQLQGNYVGGSNSVIDLNVSGTGGNTGQANHLTITGKASGARRSSVSFPSTERSRYSSIRFRSSLPDPAATRPSPSRRGPPSLFNYSLQQDSRTPSDPTIDLAPPTLNTAAIGSIANGLQSAVESVTSGLFRGLEHGFPRRESLLGAPPKVTPNQIDAGVWTRGASGMNTEKSVATDRPGFVSDQPYGADALWRLPGRI